MTCKCENLEDKIIKYKSLIGTKEKNEIFEELNIHNECCREKLHDMFKKYQKRIAEKIIEVNLILVSKKARPAASIVRLSDSQIRKIKSKYPNLIYTFESSNQYGKNYFVSYKKLPIRKEEESDSAYTGRLLGYQYPVDLHNTKPKYFVRYSALIDKDEFLIYSEGIKFKSRYKSNKAKFSKALKPYGYTVEEYIKKNPRYKN